MLFKRNFWGLLTSLRRASSLSFRSSEKIEVGKYLLLSIPVATFGLGTWQVQRRKWKLNLIEELDAKSKAPPVDLPEILEDVAKLEYCAVRVRGTFDHSKEICLGPRTLVTNKNSPSSGLITSQTPSGYYIITPFKLADKDMTILVNRGWVPRSKLLPKVRQEGQIAGEIDLVGVVRLPEKRPIFSPKNPPNSNMFHFRDTDAIAKRCEASPIFLDATLDSTVPGGPKGGQTRVTLRNEHFSYILTWYSISAATSWIWYKKFIRSMPLM